MGSDIALSIIIYVISGICLFKSINLSGGAEFFPRLIAVLLIIMATLLLRKALKDKPKYEYNNMGRVLTIFGLSALYAILIQIVGFYTTSVLFIIAVMYLLGIKKKMYYLIIPLSVAIFMYVVFSVIFMIPVPTGFII